MKKWICIILLAVCLSLMASVTASADANTWGSLETAGSIHYANGANLAKLEPLEQTRYGDTYKQYYGDVFNNKQIAGVVYVEVGQTVTLHANQGQFAQDIASGKQAAVRGIRFGSNKASIELRDHLTEKGISAQSAKLTDLVTHGSQYCWEFYIKGIKEGVEEFVYDGGSGGVPQVYRIVVTKGTTGAAQAPSIDTGSSSGTAQSPSIAIDTSYDDDEDEETYTAYNTDVKSADTYSYAEEVVRLTNNKRAAKGLHELEMDDTLMEAAMLRAEELYTSFSHTRPNGEKATTWTMTLMGANYAAENIAKYQASPQAVITSWTNSSGHYKNMTSEKANLIGVGCYQDANGKLYWVQLFAA